MKALGGLVVVVAASEGTTIGNGRIKAIAVRADECGGERRISLDGQMFSERLMLHVLPKGIRRIRNYGVLANGCKKTQ